MNQIVEKLEKKPKDSKKFVTMWRAELIIAVLLAATFAVATEKVAPWVQLTLAIGVVLIPFTYLVGAHAMETIILAAISKAKELLPGAKKEE